MKILTISSVFPNSLTPLYGLFVYERTRHIAGKESVKVISPIPWSPFDSIIRIFKKKFRLANYDKQQQNELEINFFPFLCFPGLFKFLDGYLYYLSLIKPVEALKKRYPFDVIDAHFSYPDGVAACLLAKKFSVPFTITLRGTEVPYSKSFYRKIQMKWVFQNAAKIISVSQSLSDVAYQLGADKNKLKTIPNGINTDIFHPKGIKTSRQLLRIDENTKVLLSVGGLVKRKGFHRVIRLIPGLKKKFGNILYLIVGGSSSEGNFLTELESLVKSLNLENCVRFEGVHPPHKLPLYYSASDLFVLASSNEGWPNVIVESLACGTPVVATEVGGIKEIVSDEALGFTVPFNDSDALLKAMEKGLKKKWDFQKIEEYAHQRSWSMVADEVVSVFSNILK